MAKRPYTDIKFHQQEALKAGIDKISNAVKSTLGPSGKNVMIKAQYGTISTKDGVSVARVIDLEDPIENIGAQLIKKVAIKAADESGDGTTTATVLAQSIYTEAIKMIRENKNVRELKAEFDLGLEKISAEINAVKTDVSTDEQILNVSCVSANNDKELGRVVAETFLAVDEDSPITIEDGMSNETSYEVINGYQFDSGFAHENLITDWKHNKVISENAFVFISLIPINSLVQIKHILEMCHTKGKAITLFVNKISPAALGQLINNKAEGNLDVNVVQMLGTETSVRATAEDIGTICGCDFLDATTKTKLEDTDKGFLGFAKKIVSDKKQTVILGDEDIYTEQLSALTEKLQHQISNTKHKYDLEQLEKRLNRLSCKVGVITVGGRNEIEQKERKDRVDDALGAVRSAKQQGVIVGGGVALYNASNKLNNMDVTEGEKIIYQAIKGPFKQILENAGIDYKYNVERLLEATTKTGNFNLGVNVFTNEIADLYELGILDPVKVILTSLEAAISVVGELLTTDAICVIVMPEGLQEHE